MAYQNDQQIISGSLNFNDMIVRLIFIVSLKAIEGDTRGFGLGVEVVRNVMHGYVDTKYQTAFNDETMKVELKKIAGTSDFRLATYKFRELVSLASRKGFIPYKRVMGVLNAKTLDVIREATGS